MHMALCLHGGHLLAWIQASGTFVTTQTQTFEERNPSPRCTSLQPQGECCPFAHRGRRVPQGWSSYLGTTTSHHQLHGHVKQNRPRIQPPKPLPKSPLPPPPPHVPRAPHTYPFPTSAARTVPERSPAVPDCPFQGSPYPWACF